MQHSVCEGLNQVSIEALNIDRNNGVIVSASVYMAETSIDFILHLLGMRNLSDPKMLSGTNSWKPIESEYANNCPEPEIFAVVEWLGRI